LPSNSKTLLERVSKGKPFSLLVLIINAEAKKFSKPETWTKPGCSPAWVERRWADTSSPQPECCPCWCWARSEKEPQPEVKTPMKS